MVKHRIKTNTQAKSRGRPRVLGAIREPNGRISRAKDPAAKLALETRARRFLLTLAQAADPRSGTHLGRLSLRGAHDGLSDEQYEAAIRFLKIRNDYQKAILSPGAYYEGSGLAADGDLTEYQSWVARAKKRFKNAMRAIDEAQFDNGQENLYAALQYVIIKDMDMPHLLGATRMVLNALHRHFHRAEKFAQPSRFAHITLAGMHEKPNKLIDRREQSPYHIVD